MAIRSAISMLEILLKLPRYMLHAESQVQKQLQTTF